ISKWADYIIIADQNSTDRSIEICKQFKKVSIIKNEESGHSNKVRWLLLEEARKIEGNNLIFCIDADEVLSPNLIPLIEKISIERGLGVSFSLKWIQLWKKDSQYRDDGVWHENYK